MNRLYPRAKLISDLAEKLGLKEFLEIGMFSGEISKILFPEVFRGIDENFDKKYTLRLIRNVFLNADVDLVASSIGGNICRTEAGAGRKRLKNLNEYPGYFVYYMGGIGGVARVVWEIMDSTVFNYFSARTILDKLRKTPSLTKRELFNGTNYNSPVVRRLQNAELVVKNLDYSYSLSKRGSLILGQETEREFLYLRKRWTGQMIKLYK